MNKWLFHICTYALLLPIRAGGDCKLGQVYILSPKNLQAAWKLLSFFIAQSWGSSEAIISPAFQTLKFSRLNKRLTSHAENKDTPEEEKFQSHGSQCLHWTTERAKGMGKKQLIFCLSEVTAYVLWVLLNFTIKLYLGMEKAVDMAVWRKVVIQDEISCSYGGECPPGELIRVHLRQIFSLKLKTAHGYEYIKPPGSWKEAGSATQDQGCCPRGVRRQFWPYHVPPVRWDRSKCKWCGLSGTWRRT